MSLHRSLIVLAVSLIAGCSSSRPDGSGDDYFDPVRVTHVSRESEGAVVPELTAPANATGSVEPMVRQMMRDQGKRLSELERRLAAVETRQDVADVETKRSAELTPGEEALLAMIRQQGLRLEEIMEQVRMMTDRRDSRAGRALASVDRRSPRGVSTGSRYASAVAAYQKGNYRSAEGLFARAMEGPIDPSLKDNCRFWIGVSRFQMKDLVGARLALEPVVRDATSDKRTAAILMLGQVFEGMGRRDLARNAYERIVREHPGSSLRPVAERKLAMASMKG